LTSQDFIQTLHLQFKSICMPLEMAQAARIFTDDHPGASLLRISQA
jgi:hypothetical protein